MAIFTLVRHSGYAVGGNAAFEDAVEASEVTDRQAYSVRAAGGAIYPTQVAAHDAALVVNAAGRAETRGHFSSLRVAGAEIYVPAPAR